MREKLAKQLYGKDLDIVKEGLDPSQVEDLITELVTERDVLLQRQDHLASLTRLAERSIAEADKLAEDIKREAEEAASNKANAILTKAEQEAKDIAEQKRNEILAAADKEAQAIRNNAQREVELLISRHRQQAEKEIKEMVQKLHSQLMFGLKDVTEHAVALQAEWESKLSGSIAGSMTSADNPPSPDSKPAVDSEPAPEKPASVKPSEEIASQTAPESDLSPEPSEETASPTAPESDLSPEPSGKIASPTTPEPDLSYRQDILEQLEQAWLQSEAKARTTEKLLASPPEATSQPETAKKDEAATAPEGEAASNTYEGTLALDILPPLTATQLVEIQKYLRAWPGIGITELSPNKNGYSITLFLHKPMQLIDILKQLPEVADAKESNPEDGKTPADSAANKEGIKRIAVTVSSKNK